MPMLNLGRNIYYRSRNKLLGRFSLLLIPTFTSNTYKYLPAFVMHMPIIPATRLKCNVRHTYSCIFAKQRSKIAVSNKIFGICRIRLTLREYHILYRLALCKALSKMLRNSLTCPISLYLPYLTLQNRRYIPEFALRNTHIQSTSYMSFQLRFNTFYR